jgi:hypothetical protein
MWLIGTRFTDVISTLPCLYPGRALSAKYNIGDVSVH